MTSGRRTKARRRTTDKQIPSVTAPTLIVTDEAGNRQEIVGEAVGGAEADAARRAGAARDRFLGSCPARLRDTPEARRMAGFVAASRLSPVRPEVARRFAAEWAAFLEAQPEAAARRAGLWTPGGS